MKIWKMVGCLALLAVIICGCVILGQNMEVAAKTPEEEGKNTGDLTEAPEQEKDAAGAGDTSSSDNTTTVTKTYSEGLSFRSNGDGTCAVSGIGRCNSACILIPPKSPAGDTVTEILPFAFADTIVGAIELPSTLTTLTSAAFKRCPRLALVRVESGNTSFLEYDGLLYTADGKTLLYCPPGRGNGDIHLHDHIRRVAAGAFAECETLGNVYFSGSTAEWHALIVGDENDALYSASLKFNAA